MGDSDHRPWCSPSVKVGVAAVTADLRFLPLYWVGAGVTVAGWERVRVVKPGGWARTPHPNRHIHLTPPTGRDTVSGMEARHTRNIVDKAQLALDVLEATILPDIYSESPTHHDQLVAAYHDLFEGGDAHDQVWEALALAVTAFKAGTDPRYNLRNRVTFNTSRPAIASLLRHRIRETDTDQNDALDPFAIFGQNESGMN